MKEFTVLIKKEFERIFSNSVLTVIFFGAPLLYGLLFTQVYKQGKLTELEIAVVDEDQTMLSGRLIEALEENESLKVVKVSMNAKQIAREMPMKEYASVIHIPTNFEKDILLKRYPELMIDINMANLVTANFASKSIQIVLGTISAGIEIEALKKAGMNSAEALTSFEPFKSNYNRFYNPSGNYLYMMFPGIMGTVMQQIIFLALGLAFARDFEDGYFQTLITKNQSPLYQIALKTVPFTLLITIMWLVVGLFYKIFNVDIPVFQREVIALVVAFSLACMFIGMLVSLALPNQLRATEVLMVIAMPSFLLSGYTWPLSGMPQWIQNISNSLPLTHFLDGFRKISIYGGNLYDLQGPLLALGLTCIVCFVALWVLMGFKIKKQIK